MQLTLPMPDLYVLDNGRIEALKTLPDRAKPKRIFFPSRYIISPRLAYVIFPFIWNTCIRISTDLHGVHIHTCINVTVSMCVYAFVCNTYVYI